MPPLYVHKTLRCHEAGIQSGSDKCLIGSVSAGSIIAPPCVFPKLGKIFDLIFKTSRQ